MRILTRCHRFALSHSFSRHLFFAGVPECPRGTRCDRLHLFENPNHMFENPLGMLNQSASSDEDTATPEDSSHPRFKKPRKGRTGGGKERPVLFPQRPPTHPSGDPSVNAPGEPSAPKGKLGRSRSPLPAHHDGAKRRRSSSENTHRQNKRN